MTLTPEDVNARRPDQAVYIVGRRPGEYIVADGDAALAGDFR